MSERKILVPRTENPPAKVKDEGVINLAKAGRAAYNAKNGELLFLPEGAAELRRIMNNAACGLQDHGFQRVDCASDEAIFSLAGRYVKDWGDDATAFCEERGREIRILAWDREEHSSAASCEAAMSSLMGSLEEDAAKSGARFSFIEDVTGESCRTFSLVTPCGAGDLGARAGFVCGTCGGAKFPDSPLGYVPPQPGEGEAEETLTDIETPGSNTIAELCERHSIGVTRTLKAMLYVARREGGQNTAVASFVRGDYNLSMNKLAKWLEREHGLTELRPAEKFELRALVGEVAGYCGPIGMPDNVVVVADYCVRNSKNTVAGANRPGYHKKGCCHPRDFDPPIADIAQVTQGVPCKCGGSYEASSLREIGVLAVSKAPDGISALSYRDKEGPHEYPWVLRGTILAERAAVAVSSGGRLAS